MNMTANQKRKAGKRGFLAALLCLSMLIPAISGLNSHAKTTNPEVYLADGNTMNSYETALDLYNSSRYAGRVWSDKTVLKDGYTVNGTTIGGDEDFLHVFSTLGSSLKFSGETQIPLDVVFILDTSFSMVANEIPPGAYGGKLNNNRLRTATTALDHAMGLVMEANPANRVGLVEFNSDAYEVMSLGRYKANGEGKYFTYETYSVLDPLRIAGINIAASVVANSGGKIETGRTYYRSWLVGGPVNAILTPLCPYTLDVTSTAHTNYEYGMTNTQAGLYKGMNMLETADLKNEQRLPVVILITDGHPTRSLANRGSGGGNTYTSSWWDPTGEVPLGENSAGSYYGNGILALATASYMKGKINEHYFGGNTNAGSPYQTQVFTFGLETNVLTGNDADLAAAVMDPGNGLKADNSNAIATGINTSWSNLCKNKSNQDITVGYGLSTTMKWWNDSNSDSVYKSLTSNSNAIEALNYVDKHVEVDANTLEDELTKILTFAEETAPWVPVDGSNDVDATQGSTLTYIDPIGKYMEVKSVKNLLLFGTLYAIEEDGNPTTKNGVTTQKYKFKLANGQGSVNDLRWNPAYGDQPDTLKLGDPGVYRLSDILIYVETTGDKDDPNVTGPGIETDAGYDQALYVDIPANALPLWVVTVDLLRSESKYTTNTPQPLRLFYTVGMMDEYLDSDGKIDLSKIDSGYIRTHSKDEKVYFYSNWYSAKKYPGYILDGAQDFTFGDPVMSFSPAEDNRYYIFEKNLTVYTVESDGSGSNVPGVEGYGGQLYPATSIESDKWYYIEIDYYDKDGKIEKLAVPRIGSMFGSGIGSDQVGFAAYLVYFDEAGKEHPLELDDPNNPTIGRAPYGNIYTKIGGVRTGNMSKDVLKKNNDHPNNTGTSGTYYLPSISRGSGVGAENTVVNVYLGNNGCLAASNPNPVGSLKITKLVVVSSDKQVTDQELWSDAIFKFTVNLTFPAGEEPDSPVTYAVTPGTLDGHEVTPPPDTSIELTKDAESGKFIGDLWLRHGQTATIEGLPYGTEYEVIESPADQYEQLLPEEKASHTGKIEQWKEAVADFVNVKKNESKKELPATGGIGTGLFRLLGGALIVSAIPLLYLCGSDREEKKRCRKGKT